MTPSPLERAARALCTLDGKNADEQKGDGPQWAEYLPQAIAVVMALREPNTAMAEAGSEIIKHGSRIEDRDIHQREAANVWRYMIDALRGR